MVVLMLAPLRGAERHPSIRVPVVSLRSTTG